MKINNRKEVMITMYGLAFLLVLNTILLVFSMPTFALTKEFLYIGFIIIFIFCIWRISVLKSFSMEVSEHILSVKYRHPLLQDRHPVLELPIQKVISLKIEKGIINHVLVINIRTRKGIRSFYYKLGKLTENKPEDFNKISNLIKAKQAHTEAVQ